MNFHVFHASHRFGLFFHVFHEFFVPFFVPADGEKRGISWAVLLIRDNVGDGFGEIEQFLRGCKGQCQTLFSEQSHVTKRRRPRGLFRKSWSDSSWPSFGSLVSCQNFEHIISDKQCFRHRARTQSGHGPNPPPFGRLRRDRPPPFPSWISGLRNHARPDALFDG
jgi:hypothetical protein